MASLFVALGGERGSRRAIAGHPLQRKGLTRIARAGSTLGRRVGALYGARDDVLVRAGLGVRVAWPGHAAIVAPNQNVGQVVKEPGSLK